MSTNFIEQETTKLREQYAPALDSKSHSDRVAALATAAAAVRKAREHDRVLRQQEDERAAARAESIIEVFKQSAENQRRSCAAALCARAFAPGALPDLVSAWRTEPTRAAASAILRLWREFDAVAREQLGEELGIHIMLACFADSIVAEHPASAACLCTCDFGFPVRGVVEALGLWVKSTDPSTATAALTEVERALLVVARSSEGLAVEPHHIESLALRRQCATRTDWARLQSEPAQRAATARMTAVAAAYVAPVRERATPGSGAQVDELNHGARYARQMAGTTVLERIRQAFGSE